MDISAIGYFQIFIGVLCGFLMGGFIPLGKIETPRMAWFIMLLWMFVGGSIAFLLI